MTIPATAHALATTREQYAEQMANIALNRLADALAKATTHAERLAALRVAEGELAPWEVQS